MWALRKLFIPNTISPEIAHPKLLIPKSVFSKCEPHQNALLQIPYPQNRTPQTSYSQTRILPMWSPLKLFIPNTISPKIVHSKRLIPKPVLSKCKSHHNSLPQIPCPSKLYTSNSLTPKFACPKNLIPQICIPQTSYPPNPYSPNMSFSNPYTPNILFLKICIPQKSCTPNLNTPIISFVKNSIP